MTYIDYTKIDDRYDTVDLFCETDQLQTTLGAYYLLRQWHIEHAIKMALEELRRQDREGYVN